MFTIVDTLDKLKACEKVLFDTPLIACDLEASDLDTRTAIIEGIGLGTNLQQFFIPFPNGFEEKIIANFLENLFGITTVIFHNAKFDMKLLLENDLPIPKNFHDTMIMSWLIDENSKHGLKPLSKEILGKEIKKWASLNRQPDLFRGEEDIIAELAEYCCEDVNNTFALYEYFYPMLDKAGVLIDYERVELPMILVLINMEMRGIRIDVSWLQQKQVEAKAELARLDKLIAQRIEEVAPKGYVVSMRSPQQLEALLFDVLKYPSIKETPGGKRSTDNEVLEEIVKKNKLKDDDIVPMLLKYRDLDKLNGTYLIALAEQAGIENVIHANFLQHGTVTGRFASNEPNLQNIPTRHDEWNVRSAFIPREGYKFLIADYSQIELRMLAHFSRDENMIKTFVDGGDIHSTTMKLAGITERRVAKNVNFGIVYGIGPRGLVQLIGGKEEKAKQYIERFLNGYPMVKDFIRRVKQQTLNIGTVEMITGRKRHFHEFQDNRWFNTISRQAVNTKIQGSSADLIKVAMIKLAPLLHEIDAHMLVQIHDEIIIETPLDKVQEAKKIIKDTMENAIKLRVPVVANIVEGDRWVKE